MTILFLNVCFLEIPPVSNASTNIRIIRLFEFPNTYVDVLYLLCLSRCDMSMMSNALIGMSFYQLHSVSMVPTVHMNMCIFVSFISSTRGLYLLKYDDDTSHVECDEVESRPFTGYKYEPRGQQWNTVKENSIQPF